MKSSKKKIKLEDIAQMCNLSISSVSRALNNEPGISSETRQKVLKIAEQHNFTPRKRKRPLTRSLLTLLIVIPEEEELSVNPFLNISELIGAINEAFQYDKKRVEVVSITDFETYIQEDVLDLDGIIIAYRNISDTAKKRMKELNIPYIFISRVCAAENYVSCNYYKGTLHLTKILIDSGHKRIGYFGNKANPMNLERFRGYSTALFEAGFDLHQIKENYVLMLDSMFKIGRKEAAFFIKQQCDAVICFNDYMAINLSNELIASGIKIPEDLSLTGFDDSPLRKVYKPLMTTIRQPTFEMGFLASRWLRDNILNRKSRELHIEVDGKYLEGESIKSPF